MRAFVIRAAGETAFRDVPEPVLGDEDVLLQIRRVGLCGTDLATFRGSNAMVAYPRIPGHEVSAVILETGRAVPAGIRPGAAVTVMPCINCGVCSACRAGRENACRDNRTLGVQCDGALAERIAVHHSAVFSSTQLDAATLAFAEPMAVGHHAVARGRVTAGDTVVVIGCGGIGSGVTAAATATGARVIVVEIDPAKGELARSMGAAAALVAGTDDIAQDVLRLTAGQGADVVIEAAGKPETFRRAIDLACYCGRVVYIGYCKEAVTYDTSQFVKKELDVLGTRNALRRDFPPVIRLLEEGRYPAAAMLTRTFPFAETGEALRFWDAHQADVRKLQIHVS